MVDEDNRALPSSRWGGLAISRGTRPEAGGLVPPYPLARRKTKDELVRMQKKKNYRYILRPITGSRKFIAHRRRVCP